MDVLALSGLPNRRYEALNAGEPCLAPDMELDDRTFLLRPDQAMEPEAWGLDDPERELRRRLGDAPDIRTRWLRAPSVHATPLDTHMGAVLVTTIDGTESVAAHVAQAHASYLLAAWTLFDPPGRRRMWPTSGAWAPQPFLRFSAAIKPIATGTPADRDRRPRARSITTYAEYDVPSDRDVLRRPWRAIQAARECQSARALLSTTWAFQCAAREPSGLQTTDRMLYAFTAIASLCEDQKTRDDSDMFRRWGHLQDNVPGLHERASEVGLDEAALVHAAAALKNARNLAAHGSDAALVNLGYPAERTRDFRGRGVPGAELALASLHASLRPSLWLAREALLHCWSVAAGNSFEDGAFEKLMRRPARG